MDSPVRKMQKRNDYNRHKLLRKIKRQRRAQVEQQKVAAEKELKRRLRVTPPKFGDGKEPTLLDADKVRMNEQGLFQDEAGNIVGDSVVLPELTVRPTTPQTNDDSYYQHWLMRQADRGGRNMSANDRDAYDKMMRRIAQQNEMRNFVGFDGTVYQHGNGALEQAYPEFDIMTIGRQLYTDGLFDILSKSVPKNVYKKPEMSLLQQELRPGFVPQPNAPAWQFEQMPGFQIKSLMSGSKLEGQISKTGSISTKNLQQWINRSDTPPIDKDLLSSVLKQHVGDESIDYNTLRREVQELIPKYKAVPQSNYADYGMRRLGYKYTNSSGEQDMYDEMSNYLLDNHLDELQKNGYKFSDSGWKSLDIIDPQGRPITIDELRDLFLEYNKGLNYPKLETFTFESPGIPGNNKHYPGNPIGHSRTFTTREDPDILHVLESQSDWAQNKGWEKIQQYADSTEPDNMIATLQQDINQRRSLLRRTMDSLGTESPYTQQLSDNIFRLEQLLADAKRKATGQIPHVQQYIGKNFQARQIQENLMRAASKGQSRMRYPTPETAAKIEGYSKQISIPEDRMNAVYEIENKYAGLEAQLSEERPQWYVDEIERERADMYFADQPIPMGPDGNGWTFDIEADAQQLIKDIERSKQWDMSEQGKLFVDKLRKLQHDKQLELNKLYTENYAPEHQTILKKYSDFPKQFQKLFGKDKEIRTVTDGKGNTWYEVDVPRNVRNHTVEMQFDKGKSPMFRRAIIRKPIFVK